MHSQLVQWPGMASGGTEDIPLQDEGLFSLNGGEPTGNDAKNV